MIDMGGSTGKEMESNFEQGELSDVGVWGDDRRWQGDVFEFGQDVWYDLCQSQVGPVR